MQNIRVQMGAIAVNFTNYLRKICAKIEFHGKMPFCATNINITYPQLIDSPISQSALLLKRTFQSTFFIHYFQLIFLHTFKKKNALKNSDYLTPAIASCMMDGCLKRPFDL